MEKFFLSTSPAELLPGRLLACLEAGDQAGGDSRGRQSAALLVVDQAGFPFVDLRADDHPDPLQELRRLYDLREPEFHRYAEWVAAIQSGRRSHKG